MDSSPSALPRPRLTVVADFDGTITLEDVGNAICERFAAPEWRTFRARWRAGEVSLPEAQRHIWGLCRGTPEAILEHARAVGALREGFDAFLDHARAAGWRLVLVSGGFDFYIEPLLGDRLARFEASYYGRGALAGGGVRISFPPGDLACERMAVCKGKVCAHHRASGPVAFLGDAASDRCALGEADLVLAVRGRPLAGWCAERADPWAPFDDFTEVVALLDPWEKSWSFTDP